MEQWNESKIKNREYLEIRLLLENNSNSLEGKNVRIKEKQVSEYGGWEKDNDGYNYNISSEIIQPALQNSNRSKYFTIRDWARHHYIKSFFEKNNVYDSIEFEIKSEVEQACKEVQLVSTHTIGLVDYEKKIRKKLYCMLNAILEGYDSADKDEGRKLLLNKKGKFELEENDFLFFDWLLELYSEENGKSIRNNDFEKVDSMVIYIIERQLAKFARRPNNQLDEKKFKIMWDKKTYFMKERSFYDMLGYYMQKLEYTIYTAAKKVAIEDSKKTQYFLEQVERYADFGKENFTDEKND